MARDQHDRCLRVRVLSPEERAGRENRLTGVESIQHVTHVDANRDVWAEDRSGKFFFKVVPQRWTDGGFRDQSIDAAAGPDFRKETECLERHGIVTVGQLAELVERNDKLLNRLNTTVKSGDRPTFVKRHRLAELCFRLREAQDEFLAETGAGDVGEG